MVVHHDDHVRAVFYQRAVIAFAAAHLLFGPLAFVELVVDGLVTCLDLSQHVIEASIKNSYLVVSPLLNADGVVFVG